MSPSAVMMLFVTLLLLLISTPSSANLIARQVYIEECEDGRVIAPSNSAILFSCVASASNGLSSSLTTRSFRLSNSTSISQNRTSSTSTNSLGPSLSILSRTSQAYFVSNAGSSSTVSSSTGRPLMTNPENASRQSTSQLDLPNSLISSGLHPGIGISSWTSISNLKDTSVSALWTSSKISVSSRATVGNPYPPSFGSTERSSSPSVPSAATGSNSSQANQSSRYPSKTSPTQLSPTSMSKDSATLASSSSVASSAPRVTTYSAAVPISSTTVPSSTNTGITSEIGLSENATGSNLRSPSSSFTTRVTANGAIMQITTSTPVITAASITGLRRSTNTASLENWPATITFCSESNGQPVVGYGFVTTHSGGLSSVINSIPSQTIVSTSTGLVCAGEVAVVSNGLTTTIELSTLPSATPYPQSAAAASVDVLTQSGVPVVYEIETLSGYENSQPVLISTDFVEVVNEHTTTQAGWWLIGYHGHIEVPKIGPWRPTGGTWGCIGGPALCDVPCGNIDIGLSFFVHIPLAGCFGQTGPPGWPGGPIISGSLPPFPEEGPGGDLGNEGDEDPDETTMNTNASEEQSTTNIVSEEQSTAVSSISSISSLSSVSSIQSSPSKAEYFIIASPSAAQGEIQGELKLFDPAKGGTYESDVGNTSVSGGIWVDYQLDTNQSAIIASRTDIILVMECTTLSWFETAPGPTTEFTNVPSAVSFVTIGAEPTATSQGSVDSKHRRDHRNIFQNHQNDRAPSRTKASHEAEATVQSETRNARSKRFRTGIDPVVARDLQKRDTGTNLVRQVRGNLGGLTGDKYPSDLAVMSWAPGVESIAAGQIDYIFEETKGEDTWVYMIDSGVAWNNLVQQTPN